jgi:hypothetical protein
LPLGGSGGAQRFELLDNSRYRCANAAKNCLQESTSRHPLGTGGIRSDVMIAGDAGGSRRSRAAGCDKSNPAPVFEDFHMGTATAPRSASGDNETGAGRSNHKLARQEIELHENVGLS